MAQSKKESELIEALRNIALSNRYLADGQAYEIKTTKADGIDIYQLFAYIDMGNIGSGIFVAPDYSTGASEAAKHIEINHKKKITLAKLEEFPINQPLTKKSYDEV